MNENDKDWDNQRKTRANNFGDGTPGKSSGLSKWEDLGRDTNKRFRFLLSRLPAIILTNRFQPRTRNGKHGAIRPSRGIDYRLPDGSYWCGGFSGAQVGAAKRIALGWLCDGPAKCS